LDWWQENYENIGKKHNYTDSEIVEYKAILDYFKSVYEAKNENGSLYTCSK
jgi:hypothetical protein